MRLFFLCVLVMVDWGASWDAVSCFRGNAFNTTVSVPCESHYLRGPTCKLHYSGLCVSSKPPFGYLFSWLPRFTYSASLYVIRPWSLRTWFCELRETGDYSLRSCCWIRLVAPRYKFVSACVSSHSVCLFSLFTFPASNTRWISWTVVLACGLVSLPSIVTVCNKL